MDLRSLWSKLVGKSTDEAYLLVQEQRRLAKLREAMRVAKERQEVRGQLSATRKEIKELEEGLGRGGSRRLIVYVVGLGAFLVVILIMRSCIGC